MKQIHNRLVPGTLIVAVVAAVLWSGQDAPRQPAPPAQAPSVGVVDVARLSAECDDVRLLDALLQRIREQQQVELQCRERLVRDYQANIEQLERYGREGTEAWDEQVTLLREAWATADSVDEIADFCAKRAARRFGEPLHRKLLAAVSASATEQSVPLVVWINLPVERSPWSSPPPKSAIQIIGPLIAGGVSIGDPAATVDLTEAVCLRMNRNADDDLHVELAWRVTRAQTEIGLWQRLDRPPTAADRYPRGSPEFAMFARAMNGNLPGNHPALTARSVGLAVNKITGRWRTLLRADIADRITNSSGQTRLMWSDLRDMLTD